MGSFAGNDSQGLSDAELQDESCRRQNRAVSTNENGSNVVVTAVASRRLPKPLAQPQSQQQPQPQPQSQKYNRDNALPLGECEAFYDGTWHPAEIEKVNTNSYQGTTLPSLNNLTLQFNQCEYK
jgi:hypothetical protein